MLSGVRVAYAALEPFPNAKGSGTRMHELVSALARAGAEVHLLTLPGRHVDQALPAAVDHRPLLVSESNFLARALAFRDRVARELVALAPDVVHFRGVFEGAAALAHAERAGARTLFEVNGLPSVELGYHYPGVTRAAGFVRKLCALESRVLGAADAIITQSQTTLAFLRRRGLPEASAASVIPNAAEIAHYPPCAAGPVRTPRLLYAGTLSPWQGVAELLMATRRVARESPVELRLAGPARSRWQRQLERIVRRLGLRARVELLGPLDRAQLAREVTDADVCVAPLRPDLRNLRQGSSPIKLFEYMAAGRALVSTDLPCVREIVDPESSGLLARSAQPNALAQQILRLLREPELAARLGSNARQRIAQSGSWSHRHSALLEAYRALLVSRPASSA